MSRWCRCVRESSSPVSADRRSEAGGWSPCLWRSRGPPTPCPSATSPVKSDPRSTWAVISAETDSSSRGAMSMLFLEARSWFSRIEFGGFWGSKVRPGWLWWGVIWALWKPRASEVSPVLDARTYNSRKIGFKAKWIKSTLVLINNSKKTTK